MITHVFSDKIKGQPHAVLRPVSLLLTVVALSACSVGPKYHKPKLWSPSDYATTPTDARQFSSATEEAPDPSWWDIFHDPELSHLENLIASQNLDVQRATEQLAESRAQMRVSGAGRFPTLDASGSYSRNQYSSKSLQYILGSIGKSSGAGGFGSVLSQAAGTATIPELNTWTDNIDASYEIDLWGRISSAYRQAKAEMQASREVRRGILIARQADMARDYMMLRGDQERLRIAQENRATQASTLGLTESRHRSGLVSDVDVQSARAQVADSDARIAQLEQVIEQQMNAIALLLGEVPRALNSELVKAAAIPVTPPRVPIGVPSQLAQRRPDVREAEARLHSAVAGVAEATAEFYPKVTIDAGFGVQSLSFRDFWAWSARAWNVGPRITLPIFQGGRLTGNLQLTKAEQREAAVVYRSTVLGAWRDVDNALIAYRDEQNRHDGLLTSVDAHKQSLVLALEQYRHGLTNYLNVLSAQAGLESSELDLASSTTTLASDVAQLYNALGGGWETADPETVVDTKKRVASR
ncbi:efflux transporter outer membrane subunit [Acetobacter oeni]|uniref:Drug-resistance related outer-membrane protein n=1 Tax=Acetobacter oeni TaxID=304077 RepID=A0A511XKR4_9PROT|nr:efflux transporter outer membrane subunit [Acetobacter oeni]MBB3883788.1 NodT family efflux transporter outer membrane factor (OMF) lipoprotein [Acetobacter oeni]NHO19867.1 efflux transporter outer membrane subunit [Acetobacter oeni]GBR10410.1 secretion system type I outer membrane efflux pump lipoprotein NodT [Acetobacter oeni LMG 21952]GEN63543.1 drug-resistance related outer-membrane protein [Acetobacter oeni]